MDWSMVWKEIALGFLLAGFIGLLGDDFFNVLFVTDAPPLLRTLENVIVGPLIAVLQLRLLGSATCRSPAVLWSGGSASGGVVAFLFADLIVIPIVLAYRKYYGTQFAAADHGADAGHDHRRGVDRRRRLRPGRPGPDRPATLADRRLRLGRASTTSSY